MKDARVIKRYANRKLYDTQHSRYVTLEQISEMVRNGDDVKIIDNKTKEDLTSVTLAQIIFEEEKKQRSFLSLQTMRNIIQNGGESFANLVTEAQRRVTSILPRRKEDEGFEGFDGEEGRVAAGVSEGEHAGAGTAEGAVEAEVTGDLPNKKAREGLAALRELREWVQQSQRAMDAWQRRMDGRIRNVVEGISPFAGVQKDVTVLSERIAALESKLSRLVMAPEVVEAGSLKATDSDDRIGDRIGDGADRIGDGESRGPSMLDTPLASFDSEA
ncbi:polyhydroxyalkanoate synthesis regulator DNA-binding domain-containing protein [Haliangium sp.]|uniref:polyhydroxyalkanoate synthesis regulator DNA-binding domain-containing protein n=1 Tax=Haliangium sp. TaxID=2663208 RepID=UPI003D14D3BD